MLSEYPDIADPNAPAPESRVRLADPGRQSNPAVADPNTVLFEIIERLKSQGRYLMGLEDDLMTTRNSIFGADLPTAKIGQTMPPAAPGLVSAIFTALSDNDDAMKRLTNLAGDFRRVG
jgi:hypothetical protein